MKPKINRNSMNDNEELATIKKPGEVEQVTKEEFERRIREIAKCKRDIVYFAEHYYRVVNLDKGLHIIKLYDIQKEFLRFLVDNNKVICVSGRQQGKCVFKDSLITVRNKKTRKIEQISIKDFYDRIEKSK